VIQFKPYQSICKENPKVTNPQSHDTVSMMQHVLTRSVGVICLSRYLQHLTLTGYKRLNNLIIYKLSSYTAIAKPAARDFANTAPYRLATVIPSLLTIRTSKRLAAPLTQTPSTAEPLVSITSCKTVIWNTLHIYSLAPHNCGKYHDQILF
jgi:hypothetical protein